MSDPENAKNSTSDSVTRAVSDGFGVATEEFRISMPIGFGAVVAALASLATCYSGILATYIFGFQSFSINPHAQAVLMWVLALLAVAFLWRDRKRHSKELPLVIGGIAALTLIVTLYFGYDERVEALAYVLLVIAALLNQNFILDALNYTVRNQTQEIRALNERLTERVRRQETEIDRLGRLKQFLAPQVAELVVENDSDELLKTHRRYIACLFCDIRNFTAVSEAIEPEEVIAVLQRFHDEVGNLVAQHKGTIGYRAGDGLMVFFNDPVPCDQPVLEAVRLGMSIRAAFENIRAPWQKLGHKMGLGIGVSSGYATLGLIGFHGRADYTAIGGVVNTASRLCDVASDGQILINQRALMDIEDTAQTEELGEVELKGIATPVQVHRVLSISGFSD
ncbi:adenylate/guanylate cyclase domain-containing protein [Ruegeria arenilitoris]|uniref:adenylate/guanylate cyclase domain-containing protein n=1 Tax=Ruegeria arenilitoris TaxID=1173585 RepID=UPI001480059C|nr:adenylate/guanylate cyclase domain-containing protein [Ruegeria arenilitoris]